MELIRQRAYARAGLVGNPSDGYGGKTLSFVMRDYFADVVLYEWEEVELLLSQDDKSRFQSVQDLAQDVRLHGYYGGVRLIKATIKKFVEYCSGRHSLHGRNFSIRYETNVPRQVGLAGSSAIIVATLRALMQFYGVEIPLRVQPSLVLSVEFEELGIAAGLQDRVIQVYEGVVYMDFGESAMETIDGLRCGRYERLDAKLLPPLYVAFSPDVGEPTEIFHNNLRARFLNGEPAVVQAMGIFADLAEQARRELVGGHPERLAGLIDLNFDTRASICRLPAEHVAMVEAARSVGASAKFAGSGGAIVGTVQDEAMFRRLQAALAPAHVFRPRILPDG